MVKKGSLRASAIIVASKVTRQLIVGIRKATPSLVVKELEALEVERNATTVRKLAIQRRIVGRK